MTSIPRALGRATAQLGKSSDTPRLSARAAFAWLLISAIFTPWGQTWVQMPQLEQ